MPQVQTKKVTFKVAQAVELRAGLVLPPGFYTGTETRTRLEPVGSGQNWTIPDTPSSSRPATSPVSAP
jgi:hypothetical protein